MANPKTDEKYLLLPDLSDLAKLYNKGAKDTPLLKMEMVKAAVFSTALARAQAAEAATFAAFAALL